MDGLGSETWIRPSSVDWRRELLAKARRQAFPLVELPEHALAALRHAGPHKFASAGAVTWLLDVAHKNDVLQRLMLQLRAHLECFDALHSDGAIALDTITVTDGVWRSAPMGEPISAAEIETLRFSNVVVECFVATQRDATRAQRARADTTSLVARSLALAPAKRERALTSGRAHVHLLDMPRADLSGV